MESTELPIVVENQSTETQRFTAEARAELELRGYIVYELTGQSISSDQNKKLVRILSQTKYREFVENLKSRKSEVAVKPGGLLKTFTDEGSQQPNEIINRTSNELDIHGTSVVFGDLPDYTEIVLKHFASTGKLLFDDDNQVLATNTEVGQSNVAYIHAMMDRNGLLNGQLGVSIASPNRYYQDTVIAPLVVPKEGLS